MAFLVWGLLACSAGFWLIQVSAKPLATPEQAVPVVDRPLAQVDLSRLLGAPAALAVAAPPVADSRFKLLGVVAPKTGRAVSDGEGVALIAVDGVPRTVRVGAVIDGELQLVSVSAHSAGLGRDGVVSMNLQLAAPAPASTGALAPAAPSMMNLGGIPAQPQIQPQTPIGLVMPGVPQPQGQQPLGPQQGQPPQGDGRVNPAS